MSFSVILNHPESKAVFPNQSASFTCEVFGGYTSWRVNGSLINDLTAEVLNDLDTSLANAEEGNALDILTIKARTEYNGTEIQCVTFGDFSNYSESVTLTVQGNECAWKLAFSPWRIKFSMFFRLALSSCRFKCFEKCLVC